MNQSGDICQVSKAGGLSLEVSESWQCMNSCEERVRDISSTVYSALESNRAAHNIASKFGPDTAENER